MAKHYKPSKITRALQKQLEEREQKGISLYGATLEGNNLPSTQLIDHAIEEQLDAANYLSALKPQIEHIIGENEMLRKENKALKERNELIEKASEKALVDKLVDQEGEIKFLRNQFNKTIEACAKYSVSTTFCGDLPMYVATVLAVQIELCEAEIEKHRKRSEYPLDEILAKAIGYQIDEELEDGAIMATDPNGNWDVLPDTQQLIHDVECLNAHVKGLKDLLDDTRKFIYDHDLEGSEEGQHIKRRLDAAIKSKAAFRGILGNSSESTPSGTTEGAGVGNVAEVLPVEAGQTVEAVPDSSPQAE